MKSSYNILFKVELLHEYFLNRKCADFEIIPSEKSKILFNRAKIIYRNIENSLTAFIEQNEDGEPVFNTASKKNYRNDLGKEVFRFYLKLKNPLFFNYTNVNADFNRRKKFYFSNLSQNSRPGYLFLSAPVSPFSLEKQYVPGDIVKDPRTGKVYEAMKKYTSKKKPELSDPLLWSFKGLSNPNNGIAEFSTGRTYGAGDLVKEPKTDNVFEAAKKFTANNVAELNDPSLWTARGQGQLEYANENDVIEYSSGNYNFNASNPVNSANIMVLGFNYDPTSPAYDVPVQDPKLLNFTQPTTTVPVNLSTLQPGKYLVKVNDETRLIYFDPAIDGGNIFGIIEIFNFLPASNDFSLLTADEKIRKINCQVVFAARSVLWKYIRRDGRAQTITDTGTTAYQFALQGDGFVSSSPIPLSENVLKTLTLEFNTTDFKLSPLPNPSPERFSKCNQNDYDYLCSEIYLNY